MKKSLLLFAVALGLLTACNPIKEEKGFNVTNISTDKLLEGATFTQYNAIYDEAGNITGYEEASDGNFIKFNIPSVQSLTIFAKKPDGSEQILLTGKSGGMFSYVPMRGSDPNQTIYFRFVNQNGEEVVASKDFVFQVAADLATEVKLLVSDDGTKVWKWNVNAPDGRVWGNMGSGAGGTYNGADLAFKGGTWWGVTSEEEFLTQGDHCSDGFIGDESMDATMVFCEDGTITCYDADGKQIRKGNFKVTDWNPTAESGKIGTLNTDAGSILWPYEINSGGNKPTWFEIAYLSPSRLVLCYPDKGEWNFDGSGWTEGTFWQFYSETDVKGALTDNGEATWTWDDEDGKQCWGNGGYTGFAYGGASSLTGNSWWGVASDGLAEQISNYGYGLDDGAGATMTFTSDGLITKSSGGKGAFSYDVNNKDDVGGYKEGKTWGRFMTTGDGVLFPVRINAGTTTDEFDIVYFDDNHFVLCYPNYPKGGDNANWMEGTFWRFKKVSK